MCGCFHDFDGKRGKKFQAKQTPRLFRTRRNGRRLQRSTAEHRVGRAHRRGGTAIVVVDDSDILRLCSRRRSRHHHRLTIIRIRRIAARHRPARGRRLRQPPENISGARADRRTFPTTTAVVVPDDRTRNTTQQRRGRSAARPGIRRSGPINRCRISRSRRIIIRRPACVVVTRTRVAPRLRVRAADQTARDRTDHSPLGAVVARTGVVANHTAGNRTHRRATHRGRREKLRLNG